MKKLLISFVILFAHFCGCTQSFEFMPGSESIFIDAQYLKFVDTDRNISLFSRARATTAYNEPQKDLFTGAYLNYTTAIGIGGTVVGRITSSGSGIDLGVHYVKATKSWMTYALPSININDRLLYSWFSIVRFTPQIAQQWKMYSSLELFSAFNKEGHLSSVQRLRIGASFKEFQFGLAVNLNESKFSDTDVNPGLFFRKQFN